MKSRIGRTKQLLSELSEDGHGSGASGFWMSRRAILKSGTGGAAVSVIGIGGLLEILSSREAIAAGMVIPIVGITREPFEDPDETPHRHTFSVRFRVTDVSPTAIIGDVRGRTHAVISTGAESEDEHFHLIASDGVSLENLVLSGPENGEEGEHGHQVSIE